MASLPAARWIGVGAGLLVALQILAIGVRNPVTRTLSSYEYTPWGWMFPVALVVFGIGIALVVARLDPAATGARLLLAGAATASWITALFPAGTGPTSEYWPGEVHRWGSIALVVLALAGGLAVPLGPSGLRTRAAVVRLVTLGAVSGGLFLAGQSLKPAVPLVTGQAPLAGGLTQRVLVAAVAAVLLLLARSDAVRAVPTPRVRSLPRGVRPGLVALPTRAGSSSPGRRTTDGAAWLRWSGSHLSTGDPSPVETRNDGGPQHRAASRSDHATSPAG